MSAAWRSEPAARGETSRPLPDDLRRLIAVVGPSGAGKDSVLRRWRERLGPDAARVHPVQRWVTRAAGDAHEDHAALSPAAWQQRLAHGDWALHWQAHGLAYAIDWPSLAPLARGDWVVFNGSRAHLAAHADGWGRCQVVEITAPPALRHRRLAARGREAEADRQGRLSRAVPPLQPALRLVNDGALDDCVDGLMAWWQALDRAGAGPAGAQAVLAR